MKNLFACLMMGLLLTLLALGCGGAAEENYTAVQHPSGETAVKEWQISEPVVEKMTSCVKEHASELKTHAHETKFDLAVTEDGDVQKVKLRSSTLHHDALESCMMQALATLSIPSSVLTIRSSEPMSGGESSRSRESRGPMGVTQALGGLVAIAPIAIIALGVTITVYVAAVATEEAIEAVRRTKKLEAWCDALVLECLANKKLPPSSDFGIEKDCGACGRLCKNYGYWPDDKCPRSN